MYIIKNKLKIKRNVFSQKLFREHLNLIWNYYFYYEISLAYSQSISLGTSLFQSWEHFNRNMHHEISIISAYIILPADTRSYPITVKLTSLSPQPYATWGGGGSF